MGLRMSLERYKENLVIILDTLIEKCIENRLDEQVNAFMTIKNLIIKDVIAD